MDAARGRGRRRSPAARRATADRLLPDRRRDRSMPQAIATFRASHPGVEVTPSRGRAGGDRPAPAAGEFDLVLLFEFEGSASGSRRGCAASPCSRTRCTWRCRPTTRWPRRGACARGPARGGLGPDLGGKPVREARRPLLPRGRLRAAGLLRKRRLPDGPGTGGGRRRRRPDPGAGPLDDPRRHRDQRAEPGEPGAARSSPRRRGGDRDAGRGDDARVLREAVRARHRRAGP